jgi:DNA repair exonuclease SbcCD ATPase subunit
MTTPVQPDPAAQAVITTVPTVTSVPVDQYFTVAQLESARQQERDKMFSRVQKAEERVSVFETELASLKADKDARDQAAAKAQKDAEDLVRAAEQEKMTAQELIAAREKEMQERFAALEKKIQADQALITKEQQFLALQAFTQRRMAEEQNNIAPEFTDYINGNTPEEIEASITKAKEKTASIASAMANTGTQNPRMPGVSPTGFAPTGPLDQFQQSRTFTQQDIDGMSMAEYAEFRRMTGVDKAGKDRGMFG